ncbi:glycosyltransferase family 4 protein [Brachybacterium sp. p3-SID957]|uniref:glycosyltransferase family 4 protein n=1 Tax=Brachybacterium sp. p3-SID957 TaxID=2916049 RepID=UPI00223ABD95|nr:glycosyltransferase family 4 protein [Brachybacterium sp. p3-SID957]MCT1775575.1 glycosyltransferase family 4 protein [Brachybacterium sp. p3-SID957]
MARTALVLTDQSARQWEEAWKAGSRPSALPYGIEHLREQSWRLKHLERPVHGPVGTKLRNVVEHRLGYPIPAPGAFVKQMKAVDVVIGMLEPQAFAVASLRRRGIPPLRRSKVVALTCWSGETLRSGGSEQVRREVARLAGIDRLYVFSENQVGIFEEHGIDRDRVIPVRYGIDVDFYRDRGVERDIDLLAVGHDRGRDYGTLFEAIEGLDVRLTLVAKHANIKGLRVPSNVDFLGQVPHTKYRSLLHRARVVAVPTRELAYPTGQSVALEASAAGAGVIVTGTEAMSEYFIDGHNALCPPVGDAAAWREAVIAALSNEKETRARANRARIFVESECSTQQMWHSIAEDLDDLL